MAEKLMENPFFLHHSVVHLAVSSASVQGSPFNFAWFRTTWEFGTFVGFDVPFEQFCSPTTTESKPFIHKNHNGSIL
eukprot:6005002-Amphidinium_carterae.1